MYIMTTITICRRSSESFSCFMMQLALCKLRNDKRPQYDALEGSTTSSPVTRFEVESKLPLNSLYASYVAHP